MFNVAKCLWLRMRVLPMVHSIDHLYDYINKDRIHNKRSQRLALSSFEVLIFFGWMHWIQVRLFLHIPFPKVIVWPLTLARPWINHFYNYKFFFLHFISVSAREYVRIACQSAMWEKKICIQFSICCVTSIELNSEYACNVRCPCLLLLFHNRCLKPFGSHCVKHDKEVKNTCEDEEKKTVHPDQINLSYYLTDQYMGLFHCQMTSAKHHASRINEIVRDLIISSNETRAMRRWKKMGHKFVRDMMAPANRKSNNYSNSTFSDHKTTYHEYDTDYCDVVLYLLLFNSPFRATKEKKIKSVRRKRRK